MILFLLRKLKKYSNYERALIKEIENNNNSNLEILREMFPNQGMEVYELQPNTEQWKVVGQAEVMVEVERLLQTQQTNRLSK